MLYDVNAKPQTSYDFDGDDYQMGFMKGTFDKCNGIDKAEFLADNYTPAGICYIVGYGDGYEANERMI